MFKEGMQNGYSKTTLFTADDLFNIKSIKVYYDVGVEDLYVRKGDKIEWTFSEFDDDTEIETFQDVAERLNEQALKNSGNVITIVDNNDKVYKMYSEVGALYDLLDSITLSSIGEDYDRIAGYALFGVSEIEFSTKEKHYVFKKKKNTRGKDDISVNKLVIGNDINDPSVSEITVDGLAKLIKKCIYNKEFTSLTIKDFQGDTHVVK